MLLQVVKFLDEQDFSGSLTYFAGFWIVFDLPVYFH